MPQSIWNPKLPPTRKRGPRALEIQSSLQLLQAPARKTNARSAFSSFDSQDPQRIDSALGIAMTITMDSEAADSCPIPHTGGGQLRYGNDD